jgi:signal transduction histidine kinase
VEISLSPLRLEEGGLLVIATVRDVTQRQRLRDFSAGALRASEEERQRIARELHDDPAQRLAALLVRLRLLGRAANEVEREEQVRDLRRDLEAAADSVRRIARGLRPPELEDAGVVMALRAHARSVEEGTDLELDLDLEPVDHLLTPDAKLVLYRVVQEALSNVVRHSGAAAARVEVRREGDRVVAVVQDEGSGFHVASAQRDGRRLGLIGMQERAMMVGGAVEIESSPGQGTRIRVEIPADFAGEVQRV